MVSTVFFTDEPAAGYTDDTETNIEAFYKLYATPFFSIKPDLQYIINPGGAGDVEDAIVAAVRVEVSF